jgi:LacI family transcriptional regulator
MRAAMLAVEHLAKLGHRRIAFIKRQEFSSDTAVRWEAVRSAAAELGIEINDRLVVQLRGESPSPELGYLVTRKLLASGEPFTALFAFNDISAIGAIQALREAGRRVPEDVSVVGFDDIQSAAYQNPGLTTVKQPYPKEIIVEPRFIIRGSTGPAPKSGAEK